MIHHIFYNIVTVERITLNLEIYILFGLTFLCDKYLVISYHGWFGKVSLINLSRP